MSRRWFLIAPLIIVTFLLFQNWFVFKTIEWSLNKSFKEWFAGDVKFESIERKGSTVILHGLKVAQEEEVHFYADSLTLHWDFQFFKRTLHLDAEVNKPEWYPALAHHDFTSDIENPTITRWVYLQGALKVSDGKIILPGGTTDINLNLKFMDENELKLSLQHQESSLDLLAHKIVDEVEGRIHLQQFPAAFLSEFMDAALPSLTDGKINSGYLDGNLAFHLSPGFRPRLEGKMYVKDFAMKGLKPGYEFQAQALEMDLKPSQPSLRDTTFPWLPAVEGIIDLKQGGKIVWGKYHSRPFEVSELKGRIQFLKDDFAKLDLQGIEQYQRKSGRLVLEGSLDYKNFEDISFDLFYNGREALREASTLRIKGAALGSDQGFIQFELKNLGVQQFSLIERLLSKISPQTNPFDLREGEVDGLLNASLKDSSLSSLSFENLHLRNFKCFVRPWQCEMGAKELSGSLKLDLTQENPSESIESELLIVDGELKLNMFHEDLWKFSDIQTKLVIHNGIVQRSVASINLAGLTGQAEIDWHSPKDPLKMHFEGKGADIARFMPDRVKNGLQRNSLQDEITLDLKMQKEHKTMHFKGKLNVREPNRGVTSDISFGFDLTPPQGSQLQGKEFLYWFDKAPKYLPDLFGPYGSGVAEALIAKKQNDIGVFGYQLQNGWADGAGLSLEKFISPYIFQEDTIHLTGNADFKAKFNLKGIEIVYKGENLIIESEKIKIAMRETTSRKEGQYSGSHRFNFFTGEQRGLLPLDQASYYDKGKGILFSDIRGEVMFHNKKLFLPDLIAYSQGAQYQGDILVDNTDDRPGAFDVFMNVYFVDGGIQNANMLLEKIDPDLVHLKFPMEGRVNLRDEGLQLTFNVLPEEFHWKAKAAVSLNDGTWDTGLLGLNVKGIDAHLDFDSEKDFLYLSEFSGTLFPKESKPTDGLNFYMDKIGFDKLKDKEGFFNCRLFDKEGDLFKIAGQTKRNGDKVQFHFDKENTHFASFYPREMNLEMVQLSRVADFSLLFDIDLSKLIHDLKRESCTPFLLAQETVAKLDGLTGILQTSLRFDEPSDRFVFDVVGKKVRLDQKPFEDVHLSGDIREGVVRVRDASIDEIDFAFDLSKKDKSWILEHFGIKIAESLIVGLDGTWEEGSDKFQATVNLLEVHLDHLSDFDQMKPFVDEFNPKGTLKGSGTLSFSKDERTSEISLDSDFTTHFKDIELKGLVFSELEPSTMHFQLGKGLQFNHLKTTLLDPNTKKSVVDLFIDKIAIDLSQHNTEIQKLNFSLPANHLSTLSHLLQKAFPEAVNPFVQEAIANLKKEGQAEGVLNLKLADNQTYFETYLKEGKWQILGWDARLKDFHLEVDNDEIKVATQYALGEKPSDPWIWVLSRTPKSNSQNGVILIADGKTEEEPINIHWEKKSDEQGITLKKIKGSSLGFKLNLEEDLSQPANDKIYSLKGDAGLDLARVKLLLSEELRDRITSLGLGSGIGLRGSFQIQKEVQEGKERPYRFQGELFGSEFDLKGFKFDRLYSRLLATENQAHISDLVIEDPAGTLSIEKGSFNLQDSVWNVYIPAIIGYDIRPSLLWESGKRRSNDNKPLVINQFFLHNLQGPLSPLSGLRGTGQLHFVNPVKKNLQNTIFAIPAEIVSRIGIDMIALTPVTGTISYQLYDEKVYFTKFKDVHSDGKLSKFYLADSKVPSYMDFDGSLHLQVKMKQYTLLFKLAELFTFNIEGNIAKPVYSIHKGR